MDEEERKEILIQRNHYRVTFGTPSGRLVLLDILNNCCFFNDDLTPEMTDSLGKRNEAARILEVLGCADDPEITKMAVIEAILKTPAFGTAKQEPEELEEDL